MNIKIISEDRPRTGSPDKFVQTHKNSNSGWTQVNYARGRGQRGKRFGRGQLNVRAPVNNQVREFHNNGSGVRLNSTSTLEEPTASSQVGLQPDKQYSEVVKSSRPITNRVLHGTKQVSLESELKPVKKIFWMFLSGLDPTVESNAVITYLNELNESSDYLCERLNARYGSYSSFKVGVPYEMGEGLMDPNIWPQGCIIAKFRAPRFKRQSLGDDNHFLDWNKQRKTVT